MKRVDPTARLRLGLRLFCLLAILLGVLAAWQAVTFRSYNLLKVGSTSPDRDGLVAYFERGQFRQPPDIGRVEKLVARGIRGSDLAPLSGAPNLRTVSVWGNVGEANLSCGIIQHLSRCPNVEVLQASIADEDLQHLILLKKLKYLYLSHSPLTDAGLRHLENMSQLRILGLKNTNVTPEGIERLKQALPQCEIRVDSPQSKMKTGAAAGLSAP